MCETAGAPAWRCAPFRTRRSPRRCVTAADARTRSGCRNRPIWGSRGLSRMACSWAGISSSIDPVMNLHQPRWEYAWAQLRLSAITVSYSGMASAYRCCARSTWALAKCAIVLRGSAAKARSANSSARAISAAAVSAIKSRTRAVERDRQPALRRGGLRIERQALARTAQSPPRGFHAMAASTARRVRAEYSRACPDARSAAQLPRRPARGRAPPRSGW